MRRLTAFRTEQGELIVFDPEDGSLSVYDADGARTKILPTSTTDLEIRLPGSLPGLGVTAGVKIDADGLLTFLAATDYLTGMGAVSLNPVFDNIEVQDAFSEVKSRLNTIITALQAHKILMDADVPITPVYAEFKLASNGPNIVVPAPASMRVASAHEYSPFVRLGGVDPTVIIS